MTNTNNTQDLGQRIERLVQEHIVASRLVAQEAVERAFASVSIRKASVRAPQRIGSSSPAKKRRASSELAALAERFYQVVRAKPGETMTALAPELGASARELSRSVALLKRTGRIRSVGHRSLTRYFPVSNGATASG